MTIASGSTLYTDIRIGATALEEVRLGSVQLWTATLLGTDFGPLPDAADLGADWTDEGSADGILIGVTNGIARIQIPDAAIGGPISFHTSKMRYDAAPALADDGYIECQMASKGSGYDLTSLANFNTHIYGRGSNSSYDDGVGIGMQAGQCWITRRVANVTTVVSDSLLDNSASFQPGDKLRLEYVNRLFTLWVAGVKRVTWTDSGDTSEKDSDHRSLLIDQQGGKSINGPRRFSPAFDYVRMG